jgi:hypothetical protein
MPRALTASSVVFAFADSCADADCNEKPAMQAKMTASTHFMGMPFRDIDGSSVRRRSDARSGLARFVFSTNPAKMDLVDYRGLRRGESSRQAS